MLQNLTSSVAPCLCVRCGDAYGYRGRIDKIFEKDVAPRMKPEESYLDFTAASLYLNSQLSEAVQVLVDRV